MVLRWITLTAEIPSESRIVTYNYLSIALLRILFWGIAEIFVLLHLIQNLPPIQSSFLFSLQFLLILLLDFPTGGLGDSIGHRTVLVIAHLLQVMFYVVMFLANSFEMFLFAIIVLSVGFSQESGALEAWYDNNYKYTVGTLDDDRTKYTAIKGRLDTFRLTILGAVFVLGGIIADVFSRQSLFAIAAFGYTGIVILDIVLLKPTPATARRVEKQNVLKNLRDGIAFSIQSWLHASFFLGFGILWASSTVWYIYLLFPIYDVYAGGQDFYTGLLRAIIFIAGIPLSVLATYLSKKMRNTEKWMIITNYFGGIGFFLSAYLLFVLVPPEPRLVIWKYISLIIVFLVFGGIWFSFMSILGNRYFLDFFPDQIRNSMFSFTSSLASFLAIPIQILVGLAVQYYSLQAGILTVWLFVVFGNIFATIALLGLRKRKQEGLLVTN